MVRKRPVVDGRMAGYRQLSPASVVAPRYGLKRRRISAAAIVMAPSCRSRRSRRSCLAAGVAVAAGTCGLWHGCAPAGYSSPRKQVPPNPTRPPKALRSLLTQPAAAASVLPPGDPGEPGRPGGVDHRVHPSPSRSGPELSSQRRRAGAGRARGGRAEGGLEPEDPSGQNPSGQNPASQMRQGRERRPRNRQTVRSGPARRRYPPPAQQVTVVRGPWPSVRVRIWSRPRGIPAARRRPGERARAPSRLVVRGESADSRRTIRPSLPIPPPDPRQDAKDPKAAGSPCPASRADARVPGPKPDAVAEPEPSPVVVGLAAAVEAAGRDGAQSALPFASPAPPGAVGRIRRIAAGSPIAAVTRAVGSGGTADRVDILAEVTPAPRVDALPGLDAVGPPGAAVDVAPVAAAERVVPGDIADADGAARRDRRGRGGSGSRASENAGHARSERRGRADDGPRDSGSNPPARRRTGRTSRRRQSANNVGVRSDRSPGRPGARRRRRNTRCSSRSHARHRAGGRRPWRCGRHRRGRSGPRRRTGGRSSRPRDCRRCHRAGGGRRRLGRSRRADSGGAGQRSHHDGPARRAVLTWVAGCRLLVRCCTGETTRERRRTCGPPCP